MKKTNNGSSESECCICFGKKIAKSTCCKTCKTEVCIDCFVKMIGIDYINYDNTESNVRVNYKCPICRTECFFKSDEFNKRELVKISNFMMVEHSQDWILFSKKLQQYKKQYDNLSKLAMKRGIVPKDYGLPTTINLGFEINDNEILTH